MIVRQNPWEALLPQMLMLKFKHGLDMDIADKEIAAAKLVLEEEKVQAQGKRTGQLLEKDWSLGKEGEEGVVFMPAANKFMKPPPEELTKGTGFDTKSGTRIVPWFDKRGRLVARTNVGEVPPTESPASKRERDLVAQKNLARFKASLKDKDSQGIPVSAKDLRGEFIKQSKVYVSVRDAYNRVEASAKDPSAAGDLALIFNYMKILDPGSVVRESEFATAETAGSVPQRIWAKYNKVLQGERLAPTQRKDFLGRSRKLYGKQEESHKQSRSEYSRLANRYKTDPRNVIVDYLPPKLLTPKQQKEADDLLEKYPFLKD